MKRFLPRFYLSTGASFSDGEWPDADGFVLGFAWFGFIVEWSFYRRRKP